ncbi:hypothetical protein GCM10009530_75290 [Microbispora corallina]|uniref:Uncharacterized protein n=1 Tax=Microbispora corallina TaxID=83302 RepID=A0ABQ4G7W3_9ACTN|nr:hypothetical protein [Microbispora corallina]GIH43167.1 hypothetical protein Mco01_61670 [Microbispora corallina]
MTGLLFRVPAEGHRALCTHDLTGLHPWGGTLGDDVRGTLDPTDPPTRGDVFIAMDPRAPGHDRVGEPGARLRHPAANLADAVPVSQVTWTSAPHITADVPERH